MFQRPFALDVLGMEPRVDDGDTQMVCHAFEQPRMVFIEGVLPAALERDDADRPVFVEQRNGDLRPLSLIPPGVVDEVVGVPRDVADDLCPPLSNGAADDSPRNIRA